MKKQKDHVHKLTRHKYKNGTTIYFCTLPDCYHKVESHLALGKESICHICGDVFTMNERSVNLKRPHCIGCGRKRVEGPDGKRRYIVQHKNRVLSNIATENASDLRSRLSNVTSPVEKDI